MLLCVALVRILTPHGETSSASVAIAQIYYHEDVRKRPAAPAPGPTPCPLPLPYSLDS